MGDRPHGGEAAVGPATTRVACGERALARTEGRPGRRTGASRRGRRLADASGVARGRRGPDGRVGPRGATRVTASGRPWRPACLGVGLVCDLQTRLPSGDLVGGRACSAVVAGRRRGRFAGAVACDGHIGGLEVFVSWPCVERSAAVIGRVSRSRWASCHPWKIRGGTVGRCGRRRQFAAWLARLARPSLGGCGRRGIDRLRRTRHGRCHHTDTLERPSTAALRGVVFVKGSR